jgi:hypothetical protein
VYISPFNDFSTGPYEYKGADELDFRMNFLLACDPDAAEPKGKHDRTKYVCGADIWLPGALRREDATAGLSHLFPGLQDAKVMAADDEEEGDE